MTRQYTATIIQWNGQPCRHKIDKPVTLEQLGRILEKGGEDAAARIKWTHTLLSPEVAQELIFNNI